MESPLELTYHSRSLFPPHPGRAPSIFNVQSFVVGTAYIWCSLNSLADVANAFRRRISTTPSYIALNAGCWAEGRLFNTRPRTSEQKRIERISSSKKSLNRQLSNSIHQCRALGCLILSIDLALRARFVATASYVLR
ncbi:hypothetical protein KC319_g3 [Hortaea werneckii]|nr:hypothetical protein KC319_g3 [Hortaea werneckii]